MRLPGGYFLLLSAHLQNYVFEVPSLPFWGLDTFREQKPCFPHRLDHVVSAGSLPEIFRNLPGTSLAVTAPGFPKIFQAVSTGAPFTHQCQ